MDLIEKYIGEGDYDRNPDRYKSLYDTPSLIQSFSSLNSDITVNQL